MTKLWCKLWNFILNTFTSVIEGVGVLLETVGTVLVEVISGVADSVGKALGLSGSTVLLIGLGLGIYFLASGDDDEKSSSGQGPAGGLGYGV